MPSLARSASPRFHHGYFSGDGYTYNAYPDYFPQHLSLVSLIAGQRPPRLDQPFHLVEFGCGQGIGLCLQAALHPHASFSGNDVLASHISHGRSFLASATLTNSFEGLLPTAFRELLAPHSDPELRQLGLDGHSGAGLAAALDANLRDLGREVQQDGRTLAGQERADVLRRQGDQFLLITLPRLQRLGAVA